MFWAKNSNFWWKLMVFVIKKTISHKSDWILAIFDGRIRLSLNWDAKFDLKFRICHFWMNFELFFVEFEIRPSLKMLKMCGNKLSIKYLKCRVVKRCLINFYRTLTSSYDCNEDLNICLNKLFARVPCFFVLRAKEKQIVWIVK